LQIFEKNKWTQHPSWEIHVERASNLAGGKENGLRGMPMSRAPASLLPEFSSRINRCLKEGEISDVQPSSN
ncbi:MAG: hypothetical protein ACLGHG_00430, partial [Gammaproteobacteria bacterium]